MSTFIEISNKSLSVTRFYRFVILFDKNNVNFPIVKGFSSLFFMFLSPIVSRMRFTDLPDRRKQACIHNLPEGKY